MQRSTKHSDYEQLGNSADPDPNAKTRLYLSHVLVPALLILLVLVTGLILLFVGKDPDCNPANLIGGVFCTHYISRSIGPVPGLASFYGGMAFMPSDPNTMLVAGHADTPQGAIYKVPVIRDSKGKIVGFNNAQEFARAPGIDSSIAFDPNGRGILFVSAYPSHSILEFRPGSTSPDWIIDLAQDAPEFEPKIGAMAFVPEGYIGAGKVWMASYDTSALYTASLLWDSKAKAYNITDIESHGRILPPGVEGFFFPPAGSEHMTNRVILTSYDDGSLYAMELDHTGVPKPNKWGQTLHFLTGLYGIEGAAMDPTTGDMLFSHQNGSMIFRVEGFASPSGGTTSAGSVARNSFFIICSQWLLDFLRSMYILQHL